MTPVTPLEVACAGLQKKLLKELYSNDPIIPRNLLIIGNEEEIRKVTQKWPIPTTYLKFLQRFCPLDASLRKKGNDLNLYDPTDGIENNWDALSSEYIVIAEIADEWIYALNLAQSDCVDAPVMRSHTDDIAFKKYKKTFLEFLQSLA